VGKFRNGWGRGFFIGFCCTRDLHDRRLHARFFKLEAGNCRRSRSRLAFRQMVQGLANALVVSLTVIAAAEILVEQSSQRPQVLSTILAPHAMPPFLEAWVHYMKNWVLIKDFF